MEWVEVIAPAVALISVIGVVFNYSVIQPLNAAIKNLDEAIEMMRQQLHEIEDKRQSMAERLAKVEASASSAHKRIDGLEERTND